MGFTLYSLIEAALLCVNAIAILNEQRVLSRWSGRQQQQQQQQTGYGDPYGNPPGATSQLLNLIRSVRTVMRIPLIAFNIVTILLLLLFG